jgi:hypothetical protein
MEQEQTSDKIFNVEIDMISRDHLKTITVWARIIALVGLINLGLTLIRLFANPAGTGAAALIGMLFFVLIYLSVMTLLYFFLLRFANRTSASLNTQNQDQFNSGIGSLATYFKILGIIIIIVLSLVGLFFMFLALGAAFR